MSGRNAIQESARFSGIPEGKKGKRWRVTLLEEGVSKNGRYYSPRFITETAKMFEGKWANTDHPTKEQRAMRPEGSIGERAGFYSNVTPVRDDKGKMRLDADFNVVLPWVRESLLAAYEMGRPDWAGFSINATATKQSPRMVDGRYVQEVHGLASVDSVDLVTVPGAGGAIRQLLESHGGMMDPEDNKTGTPPDVQRVAEAAASAATEQIRNAILEALAEDEAEDEAEYDEYDEDADLELDDDEYDEDDDYDDDEDYDDEQDEINESFAGYISAQQEQLDRLNAELYLARGRDLIDAAITEAAGLPDAHADRARERLNEILEAGTMRPEDVARIIESERGYASRMAQSNPAGTPFSVTGTQAPSDHYYKALQATIDGSAVDGVQGFRSIKEAYMAYPGNEGLSWLDVSPLDIFNSMRMPYDSQRDNGRIMESVSTATFGNLTADVLYNRMLKIMAGLPYNDWRKFVTEVEPVPDFQRRRWTRWGQYDNIPTVAEGAPYQPLTTPTDEQAYYSIAKYGGLEEVTLEAIANDYLGQLRRIPSAMAYAATRTIYESVMDTITTGGLTTNTTYDATPLYHSSHGNLTNDSSIVLTPDGLNAIQIAMRLQRPYGAPATEFMGPRNQLAHVILGPTYDLRARALLDPSAQFTAQLTASPQSGTIDSLGGYIGIDPRAFASRGIQVTIYDKLEAQSDPTWFVTASPSMVDMLVVGFLNGRDAPDLFVQDQSVMAGSAFSADKITYKVRWFWGVGVLDHRGVYAVVEG